jgi:molybdenum cofactor biosynthesis enzyme MoaA
VRSQLVVTHRTCNQNCGYCTARTSTEDRAFARTDAVLSRLRAAMARGPREVVLSGGEPGMRADLPALVAAARRAGAEEVTLETNATLFDEARSRELREAGLTLARVNLSAWGDALDELTRDAGGFARALAGVRALLGAGVPVEVSAVVVRATAPAFGALPERLVEALGPRLRGLRARVPVESPDPSLLVTYPDAVAPLLAAQASARRAGLPFKLAADSGPPPCVFPQPAAVSSLYALTPGAAPRSDHTHPPACESCALRARCPGVPGVYLARDPTFTVRPITEDRVRRRLSLIGTVEEQVRRELVQPSRYADPDTGEAVEEALVRVNFHCNQACAFCFVSTHLPPASDEAVREAIVSAARAGQRVSLTGGEPTLNPRLVEYVALAREHGPHPVALQTNAVRLEDAELTDALVAAGLGWVMVSLHADTAALSDALTASPGTFEKTLRGLDNLHRHEGVTLVINFVLLASNRDAFPPMVRLVAGRWPRAILNVSFVFASSDVVPTALVPRYGDVLPRLLEGLAEAHRLGVDVRGFDSMCGLPLCLVPPEARPRFLAEVPAGYDRGEFVHPPACDGCALRGGCYGLRRSYRDLHGDGELRRVPPD